MNPRAVRPALLSFLALGAILTSFAFFLASDIDRPWVKHVDFNGAVWSQAAHNILRAGLAETQGASTAFYFGPLPIPHTGYYLHHPPLLHLGVTAMFFLFGEHEWAARIIPIGCSLTSVVLLWLLAAHALGRRTATLCAAVFASLPMSLRYGAMVNFEPVVLCLILAALLVLRYWEVSRRPVWKAAFFGCLLLGMWVDWPMHLFILVLCTYWLARHDHEKRRMAWTLLAMTALSALLYLLRIHLLRPDALQDLAATFLVRVFSNDKYPFTLWQWAGKVGSSIVKHYLWIGLGVAAVGTAITFRRRKEAGFRWIGWVSSIVFAMDALFVGVFQNDSYIHEYIAFYFLVPVSLMAGIALNEMLLGIDRFAEDWWRGAGAFATTALVLTGLMIVQTQTLTLQSQFHILDLDRQESEALIPALGEIIQNHFSPKTRVLCNFMPSYGPHLSYYARREIAPNLCESKHWKSIIQRTNGEVGGVIWMGNAGAKELVANLPPGQKEFVRLENESFCVWKPVPVTLAKGLN